MLLNREEAISIVLKFAKDHTINSKTKLNKTLARLNLFMIPVDINFKLNQYGSFDISLQELSTNDFFSVSSYTFKEKTIPKYILKTAGSELADKVIRDKLSNILKPQELSDLQNELHRLSELSASEIADDEHCKLLVDVDDRFKLIQRINSVNVEMFDLYNETKKLEKNNLINLRLSALIEYCYFLSNFLRNIRFKNIESEGYDYESNMFDYYFLCNLEKIVPLIKEQIIKETKDEILINKCYQYFINVAKEDYPFSLNNPNLKDFIVN
ncbi:MAG: hypothetical protein V1914_04745 [archaeon]